ncbi:hypothetical protein AUEXF2481DRAFT_33804 [Aureobasidium subglaciale EXF-2481]|uniref:Uncharacterized protein n=1 Tax=Aureobasidium subglaciale (strain EXF-2481) TaxID=1043005 RepID=A0A074XYF5_AURSE|nr:uncharacterized protein AUEXF2481DRAFT_33804 [Aureobasidium subglaciale EXF-2481]KEQ90588.1 hypothetical protein AUEXF2481DRAFT_33804 [Aureobasidium subglaciale EXF-2481]
MPSRFGPKFFMINFRVHETVVFLGKFRRYNRMKPQQDAARKSCEPQSPSAELDIPEEQSGYAGAPIPEDLPELTPSAEKKSPMRSILKPLRSGHVTTESMMQSRSQHGRHVSWGEEQYQDIEWIGRKHVKHTMHQGLHAYRKKRLLLHYILHKDAEVYQAKLISDIRFIDDMTCEEARAVVGHAYKASEDFEEHFKGVVATPDAKKDTESLELYHAVLMMLNRDDAIYHADIALEMVLKASDIPAGPEFKHNLVVNAASKLDFKAELESAEQLLRSLNGGERTNVCWNRLTQGGEGQRIWMENPDYEEVIEEVIEEVTPEPIEVVDGDLGVLAQDTAKLHVDCIDAISTSTRQA